MCLCAQALLPALLLSALFLGITVGVAIFVRTRTFYKADDVLRVCPTSRPRSDHPIACKVSILVVTLLHWK